MSEGKKYIFSPLSVTNKDAFTDASREELRALIAIIETNGKISDAESLASLAKISKARAASALVFWEEAGVIREDDGTPTITEEFEERLRLGEIKEEESKTVAKAIRDNALADMFSECAAIMKRAALNTAEIKELTGLYEQYALSPEYILTLAAYLSRNGEKRLTVANLRNCAIKYSTELDITDAEALNNYIEERESENAVTREFRKLFGIYDRALSKTETTCFMKWSKEYGYFTEIVGEAYDIAVTSGAKKIVSYTDKLLARWFETGCRTLSDCKDRYALDKEEKKAQREAEKTASRQTYKKPLDNYSDFDPEEALRLALERSFGSDEDEEEGN